MTKHIYQTTSSSCFGVCVAMATNTKFEDLVKSIGHDGEERNYSHDELREYLLQHRLNFKLADYPSDLADGWRYFIEIISNEQKGYTHIVYWDGYKIYDPIQDGPGGMFGWGVVNIYSIFRDITLIHTQQEYRDSRRSPRPEDWLHPPNQSRGYIPPRY